jgi:quercetin dioxygenase-like cupin family protein
MTSPSFESFKSQKMALGFDEVLVREWAPNFVNETHVHPFDADVWVAEGEFWLTQGDQTQHFKAGGAFQVPRHTPHAERYGSEGATFWVARKN